jgi:tripartite-type tricarboxylate transporter receptor subunit TctC
LDIYPARHTFFLIPMFVLAILSGGLCEQAVADYPHKTVTIVCPWSVGGGTDRVARFWAEALHRELGQPFVVVNRTGGAGAVGHYAGAHAAADGHTIAMITFELCTMHRMKISRLTYRDYECLLQMNADPAAIIVEEDAPWNDLQEWLDAIRKSPGKMKMSGTSTGGAWDLARAGLLRAAEIPIDSVVWVPHPGAAPSVLELMGGHLDAICCSVAEIAPQLESGQLRVLAVMSNERMEAFPDLPTAKEQGVPWEAVGWRGLALPKGTPQEIVEQLKVTCLKIAGSEEFLAFMKLNGFGIKVRATTEFTDFLQAQDTQWQEIVEAAGYSRGLSTLGDPGPQALPWLLLLGLTVAVGWESVRHKSNAAIETTEFNSAGNLGVRLFLIALALSIYIASIQWVGFALATVTFVSLSTWRLGAKWWVALFTGALLVTIVLLLFVGLLEVQLPVGKLGLPF